MSFVVEDGTGLPDATSYASVETATNYFESLGNPEWEGTEEAMETALNRASEYADVRWGPVLRNRPLLSTQALEMPRYSLSDRYGFPISGLPTDWVKGVCRYAVEALQGRLTPEPTPLDPKDVKMKKVVVGPITTQTEYTGIGPKAGSFPVYTTADSLCGQFTLKTNRTYR